MKFEWDEDKNQLNLKKHGIDFETAMLVFNDLQRIEIYDTEHSIYEDCYNTIGMVNDVLFVVYTERKQNIRLISARLANNTERSIYYDTDSYLIETKSLHKSKSGRLKKLQRKRLYMTKILPNLPRQWKKHSGWQQKTVTHTEKPIYHKYYNAL